MVFIVLTFHGFLVQTTRITHLLLTGFTGKIRKKTFSRGKQFVVNIPIALLVVPEEEFAVAELEVGRNAS